MPTYDYACEACGHAEEIFQKMSDKPVATCTKCRSRKFRRLIGTGSGVLFRGSGFYGTDYRSSSYAEQKKKDSEACTGNPSACNGPCSTNPDD